jgi:TPR repeat protein
MKRSHIITKLEPWWPRAGRKTFIASLGAIALWLGGPAQADDFGAALEQYVSGNGRVSLDQMRQLADDGNVEALLFLAAEAQRRFVPGSDAEPATELYARAATQGSAHAQLRLGNIYNQRALDAAAPAERQSLFQVARHWYRLAADQQHVGAAFALAGLLKDGLGGPENLDEALALYRLAAEAGHPGADRELGLMLVRQNDFEGAQGWIRAAAETGDASAQTMLAEMHLLGLGVEQSDALSLDWLERAAEGGHQGAQRDLAARYWSGLGVPQDRERALALLRAAAEGGNVLAQLDLGFMTYRGLGVPLNYEVAREYFEAAAATGSPEGQYRLGQMTQAGHMGAQPGVTTFRVHHDIPTSQRRAAELYRAAAEQGYVPAQLALANLYDIGHVTLRDPEQALEWYRAAAEQGDPRGLEAYETMFAQGRGVPRFEDGPVSHFGHLPEVLFVSGSLGSGDGARIVSAIERFEPEVIVLASPGGIVAEAIAAADMIHARRLGTYVPSGGQCLSACVYVFAAGARRLAMGEIGVHQLQSAQADAAVPIGDVQAIIAQIITALNRYAVPPFLIERLLGSRDMYLLSADERGRLSRDGAQMLAPVNADRVQSVYDYQFR